MAQGMILQVVENRLPEIIQRWPEAVSGIIRKTAMDVQRDAQNNLYPGHGLITGNLKNSIHAAPTPGGNAQFDWTVSVGAEYGIYVEYGTRHMHAKPYLTPAIAKAWAPFQAAFRTLGSKL